MFSDVFLAVTAAEFIRFQPQRTAYMSCHFSPCGSGLSNMPDFLPAESMLILDDSMPPDNHDPKLVATQLNQLIHKFSIQAVMLDFQRQENTKSTQMASFLTETLACPVATTEVYAKKLGCMVLLSPVPVNYSLHTHLSPWIQQGAYLEIAPEGLQITVNKTGSSSKPLSCNTTLPHYDKKLCCHYDVRVYQDKAVFDLVRSKEDLLNLVHQAKSMGVHGTIGLYQELKQL